MENQELIQIIQQLAGWHKSKVDAIRMIIETTDADISLPQLNLVIAADSDKAKWLRIGAHLALIQFERFPVSVTPASDDEDCDDEE
ncbi:hypothetical protein HI999_000769 [Salmonella enterica]|nr:hypothetical protein [Salmonella enterica]